MDKYISRGVTVRQLCCWFSEGSGSGRLMDSAGGRHLCFILSTCQSDHLITCWVITHHSNAQPPTFYLGALLRRPVAISRCHAVTLSRRWTSAVCKIIFFLPQTSMKIATADDKDPVQPPVMKTLCVKCLLLKNTGQKWHRELGVFSLAVRTRNGFNLTSACSVGIKPDTKTNRHFICGVAARAAHAPGAKTGRVAPILLLR